MILGIIINLILSLWIIPEYLGSKRKIGYTWSLIACLFLTPLIGVIITLLSPKLEEYKKETVAVKREQPRIDDPFHNLLDLKQKGIITDEEYSEKVSKINAEKSEQELKNSAEYKQLKSLLDSNILTKDEFENKVNILKNRNTNKLSQINYRIIDGYSEGLALAIDENLDYGFVNEKGETIINFIFEHAENFSNGVAKVRIDGVFKEIDLKGNII